MKRIFFVLYLVLFLSSCEDDINSPNYNDNNNLGCPDPTACNFNPFANVNDGTCIYGLSDSDECVAFNNCQLNADNIWENHTCLDSNGLPFENWNGRESGCGFSYQNGNYVYKLLLDDACILLDQQSCDSQENDCDWSNSTNQCRSTDACVFDNDDGCNNNSNCIWDGNDCLDLFVCQNESGNDYVGWDSQSNSAEFDCENASECVDNSGNNWPDWDSNSNSAQDDCDEYYQYTPGSCTLENSEDDSNADDGGSDDGGSDG
tara:strand:+ start:13 stop:795 length:783 start_codon:yes stop_codon:yes gene_type:complete